MTYIIVAGEYKIYIILLKKKKTIILFDRNYSNAALANITMVKGDSNDKRDPVHTKFIYLK